MIDKNDALSGDVSLRAIKSFLEAARLKSFTAAAHSLCLTPAAVSKQIRGLEDYLGTELFVRSGRSVSLTLDGAMFQDAAELSLINIYQAAERLRKRIPVRQTLKVCCSPAFSSLWLHKRLPEFLDQNPDIELTVLATQTFASMESKLEPDVYIAKMMSLREGYESEYLFDDVVYPVCTQAYLDSAQPIHSPQDFLNARLLDLSAYSRSQISEHIDWKVWLALHSVNQSWQGDIPFRLYTSNDYPSLIDLARADQGIALGWHHLVAPLVPSGELVRPTALKTVMNNLGHFLSVRRDKVSSSACETFCTWLKAHINHHESLLKKWV